MKASTIKRIILGRTPVLLLLLFILRGAVAQEKGAMNEKMTVGSFPNVMAYEGYITDSNGIPLSNGGYNFTFAIYTTPTGGLPIWIEEHKSVYVKNGFIRLYLGRGTIPNPIILPFDRPYFIGISIGDASELVPRVELTPTGYSFRANFANDVPDSSITTRKLAPLSVTDEKIKSLSWSKITDVPNINSYPGGDPGPGVPAESWLLKGNRRSDPPTDFLGTTDNRDLVFKTNDTARVEIDETGFTTILDTTESDTFFNGSLVVKGGLGVAKNANIGGDLKVGGKLEGGALYIHGPGEFPPGEHVALFANQGTSSGDGIAIKVNNSDPNNDNNFITFLDNSNSVVGRIEGETVSEVVQSFEYIWDNVFMILPAIEYFGEGASCYSNFPPDVGEGVYNLISGTLQILNIGVWNALRLSDAGISFASGSGDYAEYLEKLNAEEKFEAADIVGVVGGKITKYTNESQLLMVISSNPIVIGNTPQDAEEQYYEKVAFLGQVLVKVVGEVHTDDYIIPSGLNDGTGIAVSPNMMTIDEYSKIVGRAWSGSNNKGLKLIKVVVGVSSNDLAGIVKRFNQENLSLKNKLEVNAASLVQTQSELKELKSDIANIKAYVKEVEKTYEQLRALSYIDE
jgi:hypothetical protein